MTQPIPLTTERQPNPLEVRAARIPEPSQLYFLAVMALQMHAPDETCAAVVELCALCGDPWPCDQVRLAFRSLEAF